MCVAAAAVPCTAEALLTHFLSFSLGQSGKVKQPKEKTHKKERSHLLLSFCLSVSFNSIKTSTSAVLSSVAEPVKKTRLPPLALKVVNTRAESQTARFLQEGKGGVNVCVGGDDDHVVMYYITTAVYNHKLVLGACSQRRMLLHVSHQNAQGIGKEEQKKLKHKTKGTNNSPPTLPIIF